MACRVRVGRAERSVKCVEMEDDGDVYLDACHDDHLGDGGRHELLCSVTMMEEERRQGEDFECIHTLILVLTK